MKKFTEIADHVSNLILSDPETNAWLDEATLESWPDGMDIPTTAEARTESQLFWTVRNGVLLSLLVAVSYLNRDRIPSAEEIPPQS